MNHKTRVRGLIERKLENPTYRKRFEAEHALFKLEVQMLLALERQGLTMSALARRLHTSKGNVCRDLTLGGISSAKMGRIRMMAEALGMTFVPLIVSKERAKQVLPKIQKLAFG